MTKTIITFPETKPGFDGLDLGRLYGRAIQIASGKQTPANDNTPLVGSLDLESLHQAAMELGYLAGNNPLKSFNRFAGDFADYAAAINGDVDEYKEAAVLSLFEAELQLRKNIEAVSVFVNYNPNKFSEITPEQWSIFQQIFSNNVEGHNGKLANARDDFLKSVKLGNLADPATLDLLIKQAPNFEKILTTLLENKNLPQDEVEKLVAAYLTQHSELVSAKFLMNLMRQLMQHTPALQEAVLGKPGEEPPALLREVLAHARDGIIALEEDENAISKNMLETADRNYLALILYACKLGHSDALKAFENILQDKNDFVYRKKSYHRVATLNYEDASVRELLQIIAANQMPREVRKDLQENFLDFSQHIRELFPELYRQENAPAVFFLAHLIQREGQGYTTIPQLDSDHPDHKTSMNAFEAAYQDKLLAEDKEYFPPSYDNFGTLLSNDSYNKTDRETLYAAMKTLMKGDETDKILTQYKCAIDSGSQAAPEVLDYFISNLTLADRTFTNEKLSAIQKSIEEFFDSKLNVDGYLRYLKPLTENPLPQNSEDLIRTFKSNMDRIGAVMKKSKSYERLYQVYAKMTEQYWPKVFEKYAASDSPAYVLGALDKKNFYTSERLSPLTLLKKGSMSTEEGLYSFFDQLSENFKWFHSEDSSNYPDKAQLPARQAEYRAAMKEIAEDDNHNTIDAVKALIRAIVNNADPAQVAAFYKIYRALKLQALKEVAIKAESNEQAQETCAILSDLALLGNPNAIPTLFELWNHDKLLQQTQETFKTLLTNHRDILIFYREIPSVRANILAQAESALKHPGRHESAFELITYAAQQNVEGSFEILERIAMQDSTDSDAALKTLFTPHEGEVPLELEQVRQRFLDDWRNRLASNNVSEEELQHLRDLAGDDGTIIMNELSGALNDYDQRQVEKAKAEAEKKAAEEAAENMRTSASSVITMAPTAPPKPKEPEVNLSELYELIVDESQPDVERVTALQKIAEQTALNNAQAMDFLFALLWDIPDEAFVDQVLEKLLALSSEPAVAQEIALLIEDCEQGRKDSERCEYILTYLSEL